MLYLEESLDSILSEEGQTLMGLSFLVSTLDLSMKRIELLFKKSAMGISFGCAKIFWRTSAFW